MPLPSKLCHVSDPWSAWRSTGRAPEYSPQKSGSKTWLSYAAMIPICAVSCGSMPPFGPMADEGVLGDPYSDALTRQQLLTLARTTQEAQVTRVTDPGGTTQELWMVVP